MEEKLWEGGPSQLTRLGTYLLCLLLAPLVIPIFFALAKYLQVRSCRYELTNERLRVRRGVLSRRTDELELYRVRDLTVVEPFFLRLVGRGHVILDTTDASTPQLTLEAVADPQKVRDLVRRGVEARRQVAGVRPLEVH